MRYLNPVINSDYSDPDCIRVNDSYYMIASSFNHTPCVPVLKSQNLVDWKLIGYVMNELPSERFNSVVHGCGCWAPSLRYNEGKYYAVIPFPDEGIYVSYCTDLELGDWSKPWCLISRSGIEDPCPIWDNGKCYMVVGFVKSRIGFNSVLGLYEVTPDLKEVITDYKIIFDGHNTQPTIEGPKFYKRNDYFYIMAPAGSVKTGWQTCLRSKNIYGPYEEKIVMTQNDSSINGPHQGALIDLENDEWAFIHFQDKGPYGRIVHLQPARWINDWPIVGDVRDEALCGTPFENHEYLIDKKSDYRIDDSDEFKDKLSLMWQTPANKTKDFYSVNNGLTLKCTYYDEKSNMSLNLKPDTLLTKILYNSFEVSTRVHLNLVNDSDEVGLCYMGKSYTYICVKRINGKNHLLVKSGEFNNLCDEVIYDGEYSDNEIEFNLSYKYPDTYYLGYNGKVLPDKYKATPGRWIGGKYGIYAKGLDNSNGSALFDYFKVKEK